MLRTQKTALNNPTIDIPKQGFLDHLTRVDELLIAQNELLKKLGVLISTPAGTGLGPDSSMSLAEQRRRSETGEWVPYSIKSFALDSARTDELVVIEGDFVHAWTDGDYAGIGARYNNLNNDLIYFQRRNPVYGFRFWRFYLTHTAQAGKTLDLMIGREASAYSESYTDQPTKSQLTPLEVASQHGVAELVDTDILASDITPTNTPCLFRTMVMLETAGVFSAILKNGGTSKTLKLNGGGTLTADCAYMFDILVHSGDTVNFQTSVAGNVTLRCQEIVAGVQ